MQAFTTLTAAAAPLLRANIDTDLIIRIERCTRVPKEQLGEWAFEMIRFDAQGRERSDFVLNQAAYRGAEILVCGPNFGCGSSREMAVWALAGLGVRCVIAASFGDIFYSNCFQNGVLPIVLPGDQVESLQAGLAARGDGTQPQLTIDLLHKEVRNAQGSVWAFSIEPIRRDALLKGLDEIGQTLLRSDEINSFQQRDRLARPWIYETLAKPDTLTGAPSP